MKAVGRLTGGLAHDFTNPLTCVLGNPELIEPARHRRESTQVSPGRGTIGSARRTAYRTTAVLHAQAASGVESDRLECGGAAMQNMLERTVGGGWFRSGRRSPIAKLVTFTKGRYRDDVAR